MIALTMSGCDLVTFSSDGGMIGREQPTVAVRVANASFERDAIQPSHLYGKLVATRQSRLTFGRPGRVKTVYADLGDRVVAGEVLAEFDLDEVRNRVGLLERTLSESEGRPAGPGDRAVSSSSAQLPQLRSQLADLRAQIDAGTIVAPYDGIVTQRGIDVGDSVSPSIPAFQVIEDRQPLIEASVPRSLSQPPSTVSSISVVIDGETHSAEVLRRAPAVDAAGAEKVLLKIDADLPREQWAFGRVIELRFESSTGNSGFRIPLSALNRSAAGGWTVFVTSSPDDSNGSARVVPRTIDVLQTDEESALVRGELQSSDRIVVEGTHRIVPGQRVNLVDSTNDERSSTTIPSDAGQDAVQ